MKRTAMLAATLASASCAIAFAQTPATPSRSDSTVPDTSRSGEESGMPRGSREGSTTRDNPSEQSTGAQRSRRAAVEAPSSSSSTGTSKDPSSTRGRPDANYPNPSAHDTRTDSAAHAHSDEGHDDPADKNAVSPTPSAGPTGRQDTGPRGQQDTYDAASGRKRNPETACETPTGSAPEGRAAGASTEADIAECAGMKREGQPPTDRKSTPPPGATAPVHD